MATSQQLNVAATILDLLENMAMAVALTLPSGETKSISEDSFAGRIQVFGNQNMPDDLARIEIQNNTMEINWRTVMGAKNSDFAAVSFFVFGDMESILNSEIRKDGIKQLEATEGTGWLNSKVVTARISNKAASHDLTEMVNFPLKLNQDTKDHKKADCVYLKITERGRFWSSEGCFPISSNGSYVICQCNHLTSFAILMSPIEIELQVEFSAELYNYKLEYRLGGQVANVDAMSRCPLADTPPVMLPLGEATRKLFNFLPLLIGSSQMKSNAENVFLIQCQYSAAITASEENSSVDMKIGCGLPFLVVYCIQRLCQTQPCSPGYLYHKHYHCVDIDECTWPQCDPSATCRNTVGSYECYCGKGFTRNPGTSSIATTCKDVDKCENEDVCGTDATCHNSLGSYRCICRAGFQPVPEQTQ
ncbi:uncharacterized protein LOC122552359 [Chiloscyllium plagiosum]|uniref:uncharacterized protein LOC122552359 n=1 Tax=Chiloscyllium plagiosum TaxID=36176 RepID=UPI001CB871CF|nr:uncharacterized protein LOC122552359 [Chiloscyllium plagiosum]